MPLAYANETAIDHAHAFEGEADAAWERTAEHALRAFKAGDAAGAKSGWAKALEIADRHFRRGDPRIAASCTNQAFSLIRQQQLHQANKLFDRAMDCWGDSWRWVPLMLPLSLGDEAEEAQFSAEAQKEFYLWVRRGQSLTEALAREQCPPPACVADLQARKPKIMCDERKLLSAVFLIVSRQA
jgi:hypothetical protein